MPVTAENLWRIEEVEEIVAAVFSTMMGMTVESEAPPAEWPSSSGFLTAAVHLTGEWKGVVLLHCLPDAACEFAGRFLSMPPPEQVDDDVRDVLGELANMIAGNLKCTLCPGIRLSAPSVVEGSDYSIRLCKGRLAHRAAFVTEGSGFWITLLETSDGAQVPAP